MALSNRWKFLKSLSNVKSSRSKPSSEGINFNAIVISVNGDTVGPPDPVSNLRPVVFHVPKDESQIENKFRIHREAVQKWNQEFWTIHNDNFQKERSKYIKRLTSSNENLPISSDEMSIFYKEFLDQHWTTHLRYNKEWYKRNFQLLLLALQVEVDRLKKRTLDKYVTVDYVKKDK